jgi:flagellar export protein FliJ
MKPFRFRADVALQLRRREHDRALVALAHAQAALITAQQSLEQADQAIRDADLRLEEAMRMTDSGTPLSWYRSWSLRVRGDRRVCEERCQVREKELHLASANVSRSHQRVLSLERLHDLALAAWQRETGRVEQRTMDELASLRFTRRQERIAK